MSRPMTPRTPSATALISAERRRQRKEGEDEYEDEYVLGELARAAAFYARPAPRARAFKPTPEDRIRELVKAGALIVAEIERLQRLEK